MLLGQNRDELRRFLCQAWHKHREAEKLDPIESVIVTIVEQHPEYQPLLSDPERAISHDERSTMGETNPFLHLGMHIALHEQVAADRPVGIRQAYQHIRRRSGDQHLAEHRIMQVLEQMLWQAQRAGVQPNESDYLRQVQQLADAEGPPP